MGLFFNSSYTASYSSSPSEIVSKGRQNKIISKIHTNIPMQKQFQRHYRSGLNFEENQPQRQLSGPSKALFTQNTTVELHNNFSIPTLRIYRTWSIRNVLKVGVRGA